jgi:hypothetical protein
MAMCWMLGGFFIYSMKVHSEKVSDFPVPSQDITNQTFPKLFPARKNLVSDIPAGDGKIAYLFYCARKSRNLFYSVDTTASSYSDNLLNSLSLIWYVCRLLLMLCSNGI